MGMGGCERGGLDVRRAAIAAARVVAWASVPAPGAIGYVAPRLASVVPASVAVHPSVGAMQHARRAFAERNGVRLRGYAHLSARAAVEHVSGQPGALAVASCLQRGARFKLYRIHATPNAGISRVALADQTIETRSTARAAVVVGVECVGAPTHPTRDVPGLTPDRATPSDARRDRVRDFGGTPDEARAAVARVREVVRDAGAPAGLPRLAHEGVLHHIPPDARVHHIGRARHVAHRDDIRRGPVLRRRSVDRGSILRCRDIDPDNAAVRAHARAEGSVGVADLHPARSGARARRGLPWGAVARGEHGIGGAGGEGGHEDG